MDSYPTLSTIRVDLVTVTQARDEGGTAATRRGPGNISGRGRCGYRRQGGDRILWIVRSARRVFVVFRATGAWAVRPFAFSPGGEDEPCSELPVVREPQRRRGSGPLQRSGPGA